MTTSDATAPRHWIRNGWLLAHATVVAFLIGLFTVYEVTYAGIGANIGAGLVILPLLPLGLPWTIPVIADPYAFDSLPGAVWWLATFGGAVLNVGIHAFLRARRCRARTAV